QLLANAPVKLRAAPAQACHPCKARDGADRQLQPVVRRLPSDESQRDHHHTLSPNTTMTKPHAKPRHAPKTAVGSAVANVDPGLIVSDSIVVGPNTTAPVGAT